MTPEKKLAVEERLREIAERNGGRLEPGHVVEDARDRSSPLHDLFPWNVKQAAMEHWLHVARHLITSVSTEVRTETRVFSTVRYVRDPSADPRKQGYVDVLALRDDKALAREALQTECARAHTAMDRAHRLAIVLGLEGEVADISERIDKLRGHLTLAA